MPHTRIEREPLQTLVDEGLSQQGIADRLVVAKSDVRYWLNCYGIGTRRKLVSNAPWCDRCNTRDAAEFQPGRRNRCRVCHSREETERFREYKKAQQDYKGGKCQTCGHVVRVALMFHHVDPSDKSPNWERMKNWPFSEIVKKELDKTVLVCQNCHCEIHFGDSTSEIRRVYESLVGTERARLSYFNEERSVREAYHRVKRNRLGFQAGVADGEAPVL